MKIINWNNDWRFIKKDIEEFQHKKMTEGSVVTLPHTYNAPVSSNGEEFYRGKAWYQKILHVSEDDLKEYLYLEIGAASLQSKVFLNGKLLQENKTGYSLYRVNLNADLKVGENLIAIMVDNSEDNTVYPLMADFSFFGGIYRDVNIIKTKKYHFELLDNSRDGIYVSQEKINDDTFRMKITGKIINENLEESNAVVKIQLKDKNQNNIMEKMMDIQVYDQQEFEIVQDVKNPTLWNGIENPYLYSLEVTLLISDNKYDSRTIRIGFREIEITPGAGVFLNGNPIKLNGISRHQDFHLVGNAITKEHMDIDMKLISEIGANSVRLAHYQHHDYFYSLCDEVGLLVWAEIPFITVPTTSDPHNQNAKDQLERLIKQTTNHSSVYCYGVQNEITVATENEKTYSMVKELETLAKTLDPNRYTAQANIYTVDNTSPLNEITDFVGYNLYYGWYYDELTDLGKRLDAFHSQRPDIPIMVSEYGVDTNPDFHSYEPKVKDYSEEFQLLFHDNALRTFEERDYILGGYQWNMFDFASDSRDEGGKKGVNQKGLVTIDRKTKKDAFYLYKAYWSSEPFVKIAGSRFVNRHNKNNDIVILSNLRKYKLYRNNKFIEEIKSDRPMTTFKKVLFSDGENTIKIEGIADNGTTYTDEVKFCYQKEKEMSYVYTQEETQRNVTNWFEKYDLTSTEEVEIKEGYYSTFDTFEELLNNEEAKNVVSKYFETAFDHPKFIAMKGIMTIEKMAQIKNTSIPEELLPVINKELNQIKKTDNK